MTSESIPLGQLIREGTRISYGIVQPGDNIPDGVPIIRGGDFEDGFFVGNDYLRVAPEISESYSRTVLTGGELLVNIVGTPGHVVIAGSEHKEYNVSRSVAVVRLAENVDSEFVKYYLISHEGRFSLEARITGSVQQHINIRELVQVRIPQPPLAIQQKISSIPKSIDQLSISIQKNTAYLQEIISTLFHSWFIDFVPVKAKAEGKLPYGMDEETAALFPDSFEDSELGPIPLGWKLGTLSDIARFQNGYAFKSADWCDEGIPVIQIGSVKPGFVDLNSCAYVGEDCVQGLHDFHLNVGDIVVGMTGYVGETGLVLNSNVTPYLNQRVGRFIPLERMYHEFIYANVRNPSFKFHAETFATGSAQANVSGSNLMAYTIVIPPPELMKCFSNLANPMIQQIIHSFSTSDIFGNLRDSISPRLMSGELSVSTEA